MADAVRILSIDGGGIRGIIPTMVLQAILGKTKAQDAFHLIAGTFTGGIIACVPAQKIVVLGVIWFGQCDGTHRTDTK